jgi:methylmalonyl-CoA/ethylmalonyl-CoA epimerase
MVGPGLDFRSVLGLGEVAQLGCVVPDLDAAIAERRRLWPTFEWRGWTYGPDLLGWQQVGGHPAAYSMRLAVAGSNPQIELMEPISGDTSFARLLERQGESVHHLGFIVSDFWDEVARIEAMGCELLEAGGGHGADGDGAFAYLETTGLIGLCTEIIQPPVSRPRAHFTVPASAPSELK